MGPLCYPRHRFPPEIIQQVICLYLRFTLSYRDVEVEITAEALRRNVIMLWWTIAIECAAVFGTPT